MTAADILLILAVWIALIGLALAFVRGAAMISRAMDEEIDTVTGRKG